MSQKDSNHNQNQLTENIKFAKDNKKDTGQNFLSEENELEQALTTGIVQLDSSEDDRDFDDEKTPEILSMEQINQTTAFFLAGVQLYGISIQALKNPELLGKAIKNTQQVMKIRKITKINLCALLGIDHESIKNHEIGEILRKSLLQADLPQAMEQWSQLSTSLQHAVICIDDAHIDLDIVKRFDVDGGKVFRAFLQMRALARPQKNLYSKTFTKFTEETGEEVVSILKQLKNIDPSFRDEGNLLVSEFLRRGMTPRARFFMFLADISRYVADGGDVDELWTRIDTGDTVPMGMYFSEFLQKNHDDLYEEIIRMTKSDSQNYWELREIIANNIRNTSLNQQPDEFGQGTSSGEYLTKLLGGD